MNENFNLSLSKVLGCNDSSISPVLYLSSVVLNFVFISWFSITDLLPKSKRALNRIVVSLSPVKKAPPETENVEDEDKKEEQLLIDVSHPPNESLSSPIWQYVGASVIGTSHLRTDKPCQDYHAHAMLPDGSLCLVVADGAGSAPYAEIGAKIACETLVRYLSQIKAHTSSIEPSDYEQQMQDGFAQSHRQILETASTEGQKAKDYATTLIGVIVTPSIVVAGMVGDGMVIFQSQDGNYKCAFDLPAREYANQMHSITSKGYKKNLQIVAEPSSIRSLAICTDGILSVSCDLSTNEPFPPFFDNVFRVFEVAQDSIQAKEVLEDYLQHPLFNELTDDDKTLVMAMRAMAGESASYEESSGNTD